MEGCTVCMYKAKCVDLADGMKDYSLQFQSLLWINDVQMRQKYTNSAKLIPIFMKNI